MNKKIIVIIVVLALALFGTVAYANSDNEIFVAGSFLKKHLDATETNPNAMTVSSDDELAAVYHEKKILFSDIDYLKNMIGLAGEDISKITDYEIVNRIAKGYIMIEEAKRLGVEATAEEITATVQTSQEAYEMYPETKKFLDEYCEGAGITIDQYFDLMEEDAYSTITKQKLKDEIGRQYCQENVLEFTKINPPQEMMDAIDAYLEDLFEQYRSEIVYYIPIPE